MKRFMIYATLLSMLCILTFGVGCLKEKTFDVVVTTETSQQFPQDERNQDLSPDPQSIELGAELDKAIADNNFDKSQITTAAFQSAFYGVFSLSTPGDWAVTGFVQVRRNDVGGTPGGWVNIIQWSSENLTALIGQKKPAAMEPAGVTVVNTAIDEYMAGTATPVLEFQAIGTIAPSPTLQMPLTFTWQAWLKFNIVSPWTEELPDPF